MPKVNRYKIALVNGKEIGLSTKETLQEVLLKLKAVNFIKITPYYYINSTHIVSIREEI